MSHHVVDDSSSSYQLDRSDVLACQFQLWYPQFRKARMTIPSVAISLKPFPEFVEYLLSDTCFLPQHTSSSMFLEKSRSKEEGHGDYSFPELNRVVEEGIEKLGGLVMPKLNWSCPKDASWINCNGSLKCRCAGDIYLLLKSSDFIVHDLLYAFDGCIESIEEKEETKGDDCEIEYHLVLRKWCNLYPSMEFRCFVSSHNLIAVSQRHHSQYYSYLHKQKYEIKMSLMKFFENSIQHQFATGSIKNYAFDCYIDKNRRVWLLDFNIWGAQTDSLMYSWDELNLMCKQDEIDNEGDVIDMLPDIRLVDCPKKVHQDPLASYRAPLDTVNLAGSSFQEFMNMCKRSSDNDDSSFSTEED